MEWQDQMWHCWEQQNAFERDKATTAINEIPVNVSDLTKMVITSDYIPIQFLAAACTRPRAIIRIKAILLIQNSAAMRTEVFGIVAHSFVFQCSFSCSILMFSKSFC